METKNLALKFGLLALLVLICGLVLWQKGLRFGIDLLGGHSLTFKVQTAEDDIRRLDGQIAEVTRQLSETTAPEARETIQAQLDTLQQERQDLIQAAEEIGNLPEATIRVLKERADPTGLLAWEWRPEGDDRIQVRMPPASEEAKLAREAYRTALADLAARNLSRAVIRRMASAAPERQQEIITRYASGDDKIADLLGQVIAKRAEADQLKAAFETSGGQDTALQDQLRDALADYQTLVNDALATRIIPSRVETVLSDYVSPRRERELKERPDGEDLIAEHRGRFERGIERLRAEHPGRVAEIDRIVQLYQAYQNERRPGSDPVDVKRLMRNAGVLEFRVAPRRPEMGSGANYVTIPDRDRFVRLLQEEGYEGILRRNLKYVWLPIHGEDRYPELVTSEMLGQRYVLLHNTEGNVMLHDPSGAGWQLTNVKRGFGRNNEPAAEFRLNSAGAAKMATLTAAHIDDQMAIVLDDEVYSAPGIRSVIRGQGQITTGGDAADVEFIIKTLRSGSLPAKINPEPIIENTFDPAIGKTNRDRGQMAAIYSLLAVAVFMLVYYLAAGAVADFALLLNIVLILGGMSMLEAAFTLPGIAGVILTIGIAVDANVLIFERLREEQRRGQPAAITIKNAYSRAFSAIFDANVTTLITCLILGWIGTEEVRGFAVTLGLGVVASMFTAMVVTRWVFQLFVNTRLLKGQIKMLSLIGTPKINWIGKRHFFWGLSIALVAMGIASLVWQGSDVMGIEFSSGAEATVQLKLDATVPGPDGQPQLAEDALIRQRFIDQAQQLGAEGEVLASTAQVVTLVDTDTASEFLTTYDADDDGQVTADEWQAADGNAAFFELITEGDDDGALSRDDLNDRLPPRRFQVSTTEVNAELIRRVAADAFGAALQRRVPIKEYEFLTDQRVEVLGTRLGPDGWGRIALNADSPYADELLDYEDGIAFVLDGLLPTVSDADLKARIDDMRRQPDFQAQMSNSSIVIGLTPAAEGYSSLAVLVRPADESMTDTPQALAQFAEGEKLLLSEALKREEAMAMRNFDASIAGEARGRAIMAIVLSWAAIVGYLWLRFGSIQWGLAAVICLVHDVIIVVGLVAASGWLHATTVGQWLGVTSFKIDLPMVAAFLTVIGYSVNDTIVVFDRIRENRGKLTTVSAAIINKSINQTLARTLLTSGTTLIVVIIMYVWGGQSTVHGFSYALLMGVLFGTYSSVAVASPLLMGFKKALVAKVTGADVAGETTRV